MPAHLSQATIRRLRPGESIADDATPGLRVEAFESRRSFVYRYRDPASGRLRQATIGDASVLPIAEARAHVLALKRARGEGHDPRRLLADAIGATLVETAQGGYTVRDLIDHYAADRLALTKRGAERVRLLRFDLSKWYARAAADVRSAEVRELVASVARRAPNTAGRVLRELRAAYRYAAEMERVADGINPAANVRAPRESRYVPRDRAFADHEWTAWAKWLRESGLSPDVRDALLLVAFTACRPGEVTAARWEDIDLASGVWTIRARKKDGEHRVYLSPQAVAIFKARWSRGESPWVFPSPSKRGAAIRQHALVWAIARARVRDSCPVAHWTAHDLRRSAATMLAQLGYSDSLIERVVGHYSIRRPIHIYVRASRDAEAKEAWRRLGAQLARLGVKP